jgi:hypothetical protein
MTYEKIEKAKFALAVVILVFVATVVVVTLILRKRGTED